MLSPVDSSYLNFDFDGLIKSWRMVSVIFLIVVFFYWELEFLLLIVI